jgi:hypothetical protein
LLLGPISVLKTYTFSCNIGHEEVKKQENPTARPALNPALLRWHWARERNYLRRLWDWKAILPVRA